MKHLAIYILIFALVSCASSVQTSYDFDKEADFKQYKTYAYAKGTRDLPVQPVNRDNLLKAIDHQMTIRGFTKSDSADVIIDLLFKTSEKLVANTTGEAVWSYGYGYGFGPGFSNRQVNVNEFEEGTLFIILADRKTDKMIWQGRGTKVIEENASPERREANINAGVAAIFKNYPVKPN